MKSINEVNIGQKRPLPVTLAEGIDDFRKRRRQGPIVGNAPSLINVSTSLNNSVSVKRLNSPILPNGQGFTNSVPTMSNRHLASTLPQRIVAPALRAVATAPTLVIKSESPGVDGAQSNNRLFVDSKAYEVIYIGREPVIERGTLPHKVYFHGTPRNVFIDNIPYLLPFRESREIRIDNLTHLIRFGGPGRELFIGDFALNAKFGGPPITVNINGLTHSIKLEKPVPEVRIEPEPSYELLPELKKLQDSTSNAVFKDEGVKSFLLHLKNTGVIGVKTEPVPTPPLSVPPFQRQDPRVNNKPRTFHRNNVENKNVPAQISAPNSNDNNAQNTNDLSFEATLADLHASRNVCPNCGLQMNDSDTVMFSKHMDWHFRENSRILSQNNSGSTRPWNMTLETWLNFSEQQALVAPVVAEVQATETKEVDDTTNFVDALSADVEAQNCVICGEEFKEYFDDDDEEWKLQNCVVIDTIAYHRNCTGSLEGRNMVTNAQPTMSTVE
uniref:UBZ3-type domain-containing protein n=1 Tax=Rhabditophanes sp. KR3021 TaxID=114890 RepID=A0AC35TTP0_9BILA